MSKQKRCRSALVFLVVLAITFIWTAPPASRQSLVTKRLVNDYWSALYTSPGPPLVDDAWTALHTTLGPPPHQPGPTKKHYKQNPKLECYAQEVWVCKKIATSRLVNMEGTLTRSNCWEVPEQQALCQYVRPDDRIFEMGGNIGTSCIAADRLVGGMEGRVVCVEPNNVVAKVLNENRNRTNSKFHIVQGAITKDGPEDCNISLSPCRTNNCQDAYIMPGREGQPIQCHRFSDPGLSRTFAVRWTAYRV